MKHGFFPVYAIYVDGSLNITRRVCYVDGSLNMWTEVSTLLYRRVCYVGGSLNITRRVCYVDGSLNIARSVCYVELNICIYLNTWPSLIRAYFTSTNAQKKRRAVLYLISMHIRVRQGFQTRNLNRKSSKPTLSQ